MDVVVVLVGLLLLAVCLAFAFRSGGEQVDRLTDDIRHRRNDDQPPGDT